MLNQVFSVRGATTVDGNTEKDITERSVELMAEIVKRNGLNENPDLGVTEYIISTTEDITAFYPARAIRESKIIDAPIFSVREPSITGALPLCIRIIVRVSNYGDKAAPKHVYLHGAAKLRPDIVKSC